MKTGNYGNYTTDNKVTHHSNKGVDINEKLAKIIGKKFVEYRKKWDAVNRFEQSEFPLFIQVELNQNCNLDCPHCTTGHHLTGVSRLSSNLTWEDYTAIVDEAEKYNCPSISPQGNNEPLLYNVEKYVEYARQHGFIDIMFNTNATLLTEERAKKLLDCGLTRLRFSIDAATACTYARVRGADVYYMVRRNINKFLELKKKGNYKLPVTGVSFLRLSSNEDELSQFFNQWEDKVDMITTQTFVPPVLGEERFEHYYPSDLLPKPKDFRCPQPFQRVVIRGDLIIPCCHYIPTSMKLKKGIYNAWHSKEINWLRYGYGENPICKKCKEER